MGCINADAPFKPLAKALTTRRYPLGQKIGSYTVRCKLILK